ncbi:MAG: hypothetical protein KGN39_00145 [Betaproteobacteria bacterium]|nr:hypothetical protein [Betaproteobacteria bacterium]
MLRAQPDTPPTQGEAPVAGSTAFCLFEVPMDPERRVWLNLGIVQYVDLRADGLRIYYGGGNLGSGHEFYLKASREEGIAFLKNMQAAAARCAGSGSTPIPAASPALFPTPSPDSVPPPPGESHPPPGG